MHKKLRLLELIWKKENIQKIESSIITRKTCALRKLEFQNLYTITI